MKAIFPQSIDGDLLNLVHLSNGFHMLNCASPLHVGDVVTTEAKIASVINTDVGKAVKVIGNIIHEGKPVIEVTSSFLYRGRFTDYENTFEIVQEPDYVVDYIIHGKLTTVDREITARCIDILNRADPDLYQFMQYSVNACDSCPRRELCPC